MRLRRLGGLDGHPDVGVPGIEASSGSLGMGISKGRGIALAKRSLGRGGRVVVMTGDGELQEGQNYEALQAAAHEGLGKLWVIVDRNEVQSDKRTEEIVALGDLEGKLRAFGWDVVTATATTTRRSDAVFARFREDDATPKVLVARTVKGKGVSFMEHPAALARGKRHVSLARRGSRGRALRAGGRGARDAARRGLREARARSPRFRAGRAGGRAPRVGGRAGFRAGTRAKGIRRVRRRGVR